MKTIVTLIIAAALFVCIAQMGLSYQDARYGAVSSLVDMTPQEKFDSALADYHDFDGQVYIIHAGRRWVYRVFKDGGHPDHIGEWMLAAQRFRQLDVAQRFAQKTCGEVFMLMYDEDAKQFGLVAADEDSQPQADCVPNIVRMRRGL